ncbi:MAG: DUF3501 family protein [Steroidobacteraceae bacterium]
MQKLEATDLLSLEQYARERPSLRARMIEHRRRRRLKVGDNCTWSFEDRRTVQYQVQEMLRAERIFEAAGIAEELEVYNELVPDGSNLKATLLIEFPDPAERVGKLTELHGFEGRCWMRVEAFEPVFAVADEDLERQTDTKTSAVHFLRFEFSSAMIERLKSGAALAAGVDLPAYRHSVEPLPESLRSALLTDFS